MSTILDALRKLQRERSAQSPTKDLRSSITAETPRSRARQRSSGARWVGTALVLLAVGAGGAWLYRSGQLDALLGRSSGEQGASEEELAQVEQELAQVPGEGSPAPTLSAPQQPLPARRVAPRLRAQAAQPLAPSAQPPISAPPAPQDTPDAAVERARLEAALANARAAQEAQRQAELEAAAQAAAQAAAKQPPATPSRSPAIAPAPPVAPPAVRETMQTELPATPKPAAPAAKPVARGKPAAEKPAAARPAAQPSPERSAGTADLPSAFPDVRVESIRWHPVAERRVASLHFEQQDVPEAHEGDIVSGVLVYRIDPGAVELRVGSAQRVVSPGP